MCELIKMSYEEESWIHGYHLYQNIWTIEVGNSLIYEREPSNSSDRYVYVVVTRQPLLFILRNGTTDCIITGGRRYHRAPFFWGLQILQKEQKYFFVEIIFED